MPRDPRNVAEAGVVLPQGGRPSYVPYDPDSSEWEQQWAKMQQAFKEAGVENSEIHIWRRGKKESKFQFVDTIGADSLSMQGIMDEYGGGKYQFKTVLAGQPGPTWAIEIDARVKGERDRLEQSFGGQSNSPPADPIAMLRAAKEVLSLDKGTGNEMTLLVTTLLENQAKQQAQTTQTIVGLVGALAPVLVTLMTRPSTPSADSELLKIILPTVLSKPAMDMNASLEFITKLKTLANTETSEGGGMLETIMKACMTVMPAIAGAMTPQITSMPMKQISDNPPGTSQPTPVHNGTAPATPPPDLNTLVPRVYAMMLVTAAAKNAPVESWATIIEDMANDEQWDGLMGLLLRPDWLEVISTQLPEIRPYPLWLGKLRNELLAEAESEKEELTEKPLPDKT